MRKPLLPSCWPKSPRSKLARPSSLRLAVPVEIHDQPLLAARQALQQVGHVLLVQVGQVLAALAVLDHQFAVAAHVGGLRLLGLLARIDELQRQIRLGALIGRDEIVRSAGADVALSCASCVVA